MVNLNIFLIFSNVIYGGIVEKLPVVILCGGKGLRLREHTEVMPKALVPIGDMPVLLHVMKIYAHYGFNRFILALGYKGDMIKEFFMNYPWKSRNFKLSTMREGLATPELVDAKDLEEFDITFVNTGLETPTGGRVKKIEKYIDTENFFLTYCDGLADIDIQKLYNFHTQMGKIATLTGVHPMSPFGILEIENGLATSFKEKPMLPGLVNGGFFVFNKRIFDYLDEKSILEEEPLRKLTNEGQLAVFNHESFWVCMDTYKDYERLNALWETGVMPHIGLKAKPPWKIWE